MEDPALLKWHYGQFSKYLLSTYPMFGTVPGAGEIAMNKPQEIGEACVEIDISTENGVT